MPVDLNKLRNKLGPYRDAPLRELATDIYDNYQLQSKGYESVDDWIERSGNIDAVKKDDEVFRQKEIMAERKKAFADRGILGEVGSTIAGGLYDAGEMALRATRVMIPDESKAGGIDPNSPEAQHPATGIIDKAIAGMQRFQEETPFLNTKPSEGIGRWVREGARSAVTSLSTALPGAAAGAMAGGPVGAVAGGVASYILGAPLFGVAEYDSAMEEGFNSEQYKSGKITKEQIAEMAMKSALAEGGFEAASNILETASFGLLKPATTLAKGAIKQPLKMMLKDSIKTRLAKIGATMAAETGSEVLTGGVQTEARYDIGLTEQRFMDGMKDSFGPALVASMLFAGFHGGMNAARRKQVSNALENPEVDQQNRFAAANDVLSEIKAKAPEYAESWKRYSTEAIQNNQAISLDDSIVDMQAEQHVAVETQKAQSTAQKARALLALPAPEQYGPEHIIQHPSQFIGDPEQALADIEAQDYEDSITAMAQQFKDELLSSNIRREQLDRERMKSGDAPGGLGVDQDRQEFEEAYRRGETDPALTEEFKRQQQLDEDMARLAAVNKGIGVSWDEGGKQDFRGNRGKQPDPGGPPIPLGGTTPMEMGWDGDQNTTTPEDIRPDDTGPDDQGPPSAPIPKGPGATPPALPPTQDIAKPEKITDAKTGEPLHDVKGRLPINGTVSRISKALGIKRTEAAELVKKDLEPVSGKGKGRLFKAEDVDRFIADRQSGDEKQGKKEFVHDHSSTQVNLKDKEAGAIVSFGKSIPESEIYSEPNDDSYGREGEPHITVKYGLSTVNADDVKPILKDVGPITAKFGKVSIFENEKYDVVKVDIDSPEMKAINEKIAKEADISLPAGETFDYSPHATIAYVKPGMGKKYVGDKAFEGKEVTFDSLTFSGRDGKMVDIPLTGKNEMKTDKTLDSKVVEPEKIESKEPWEMTRDEWNSATRFYRSGKTKNAQLPDGERVILRQDSTKGNFLSTSGDFLDRMRKQKIEAAIKEGKTVPPEVLKDYPELTKPPSSGRKVTAKGQSRVEKAQESLREIINNPDIVGKQRADAISNGKELVKFLQTAAAKDELENTDYFKGDQIAYTGVEKDGLREFIYLEGPQSGAYGQRMTKSEREKMDADKKKADEEQQAGFRRVRELQEAKEGSDAPAPIASIEEANAAYMGDKKVRWAQSSGMKDTGPMAIRHMDSLGQISPEGHGNLHFGFNNFVVEKKAETKPKVEPKPPPETPSITVSSNAYQLFEAAKKLDSPGQLIDTGDLRKAVPFDNDTFENAFKELLKVGRDNGIMGHGHSDKQQALGTEVEYNGKLYMGLVYEADAKIKEGKDAKVDQRGSGIRPGDQEGIGQTEPGGPPDRGPATEGPDSPLETQQSEDGEGVASIGDTEGDGTRPVSQEGSGDPKESENGDAPDRREGTGVEGSPHEGAGGTGRGDERRRLRPNFRISDPGLIVAGSAVKRFERNKRAIEIIDYIDSGIEPTQDDLTILSQYTGWGSFGQELFQGSWDKPSPKEGWEARDEWLREALGEEGWKSAQRSITNAHYTDPSIVQRVWSIVGKMGFKGGRVLEPAMGSGNFFGLMPSDIMNNSELTGIELDTTTGRIAQALYPKANISIKGYEKSQTPDDFYDLVIGNWPFAKDGPPDRRYRRINPSLHDYFFLKALDQVRPGGLVVGITSAGTMDKMTRETRIAIAKKGELVSAIRLPSNTFGKYAGTKVVTDLIVFKKRAEPLTSIANETWINTRKREKNVNGQNVKINTNEYWDINPDNIIGELDIGHGTTTFRPGMIVNFDGNIESAIDDISERLPQDVYQPFAEKRTEVFENTTGDRFNSVVIGSGGRLYQAKGEHKIALNDAVKYKIKDKKATKKRENQIKGLVKIGSLYRDLLTAEREGDPKTETIRKKLRDAYLDFTLFAGKIRDSYGLKYLNRVKDPNASAIASIEKNDGTESTILSKPVSKSPKKRTSVTISEALIMSRNDSMSVDIDKIASIAKKSSEEVVSELLKRKAIFRLPGGGFEVSDIYLGGNVREKLNAARDGLADGEDLQANIDALEKVVPPNIPYFEISAKLGNNWVVSDVYRDFVGHLLQQEVTPEQLSLRFAAGGWVVTLNDRSLNDVGGAQNWSTNDYEFSKMIKAAFNNQPITIKDKDSDGRVYVVKEATDRANEKARLIREEFENWVWADVDRRVEAERMYNETMNAIARTKFDGSFMDMPGMALRKGEDEFSLRKHQMDAIYRSLVVGSGLYAHEVGTGKTYTLAGVAMEAKRFGIAKKPVIFAHNANSADIPDGIAEMYPGANVLYIDNLDAKSIKDKLYQIRNEDWDAIVVPHSLIDRFAMREETLMDMAAEEIAAMEREAIEAAEEDGGSLDIETIEAAFQSFLLGEKNEAMGSIRSPTAKQLVRNRNNILKKIQDMAMQASREDAIVFEDTGIDMIIVDEAHAFKKPPFSTKMKIKGLQTSTSGKSIALKFLTDHIKNQRDGKGVHLFTGTPITNTLTEIFHMQRYVMSKEMEDLGINEWDAWFNTFADAVTDIEISATGEFESVQRLSEFVNVAELRRIFDQHLDVVFANEMPEFTPRVTDSGKAINDKTLTDEERDFLENGFMPGVQGLPYRKVIVADAEMSPNQEKMQADLAERAMAFKSMSDKDKKNAANKWLPEAPLRVIMEANKAGLDPRLVNLELSDEDSLKVNRAAKNIIDVHKSSPNANQVVFVDQGFSDTARRSLGKDEATGEKRSTTVRTFNLSKHLVERLVAGGINRDDIAIVTGKTSKAKRKVIADKMNSGELRVVIGSSGTLGIGVNMQERLRAAHHLDAPWMPGDLAQRIGRYLRQGNGWNTTLEYRYISEKLDANRWGTLQKKQKIIDGFMRADEKTRIVSGDALDLATDVSIDDISDTFASAAGDPRILMVAKLEGEIRKLGNRQRIHSQGIVDAKNRKKDAERAIKNSSKSLEIADGIVNTVNEYNDSHEGFSVEIDGKVYTERKKTVQAFIDLIKTFDEGERKNSKKLVKVGSYKGLSLYVDPKKAYSYTTEDGGKGATSFNEGTLFLGVPGSKNAVIGSKPSIQSLDSRLSRFIKTTHKTITDDIEKNKKDIASYELAEKQPFLQAESLELKRRQLEAVKQDLQDSPEPAPSWLKVGAPIGTDVYVDGKAKEVDGYREKDGRYFILSGDQEIDISDARYEDGTAMFDIPKGVPTGSDNPNWNAVKGMLKSGPGLEKIWNEGAKSGYLLKDRYSTGTPSPGLTPQQIKQWFKWADNAYENADGSITIEKGKHEVTIYVDDDSEIPLMEDISTDEDMSWISADMREIKPAGLYYNFPKKAIVLNKQYGNDKYTLAHETYHWMEDIGVIQPADIRAISKAVADEKNMYIEDVNEEDRAEFITDYIENRDIERSGILGRAIQKIRDFADSLLNFYKHRTAKGVVRDIESGKLFNHDTVPNDGRPSFEDIEDMASQSLDFDEIDAADIQEAMRFRKKPGLSKKQIKKWFKWADKITTAENGDITITKGRNTLIVKSVDSIAIDKEQFKVQYKRDLEPGEVAKGSYRSGTIKLSMAADGKYTLAHESMHWLEDIGIISPSEVSILNREIARESGKTAKSVTEEDRAQYIEDMLKSGDAEKQSGFLKRIFKKIRDFIDSFVNLMGNRTASGIVRDIESGRIFKNQNKVFEGYQEFAVDRDMPLGKAIALTRENPNFKKWIAGSKLTKPLFHGSLKNFEVFDPEKSKDGLRIWLTPSRRFAFNIFGTEKESGKLNPNNYVWARVTKPFNPRRPEHWKIFKEITEEISPGLPPIMVAGLKKQISGPESWTAFDNPAVAAAIMDRGFDGIVEYEGGVENMAVFRPEQIKSVFNAGSFDLKDKRIQFSSAGKVSSEAFKKWFGDSKVVDADGKPLILKHESRKDIFAFQPGGLLNKKGEYRSGPVIYFKEADENRYGSGRDMQTPGDRFDSPREYPVYLSLQRPLVIKTNQHRDSIKKKITKDGHYLAEEFPYTISPQQKAFIEKQGYDGIIVKIPGEANEYIAFNPTQIKSATGNIGTYDPKNPDIRYSVSSKLSDSTKATKESIKELNQAIRKSVTDLARDSKWNKNSKPDTSWANRTFSLLTHYADKVPALARMRDIVIDHHDRLHQITNGLINSADGENMIEGLRVFEKQRPEEYRRFQNYLVERDRNSVGYHVEKKGDEWLVLDTKRKPVDSFESEQSAVKNMTMRELRDFEAAGFSDQAVKALAGVRLISNRGFEMLMRPMREMVRKAKESVLNRGFQVIRITNRENPKENGWVIMDSDGVQRGKAYETQDEAWEYVFNNKEFINLTGLPMIDSVDKNGGKTKISFYKALAEMGDIRGHYFPRIRRPGRVVLLATKDGVNPERHHFDFAFRNPEETYSKLKKMVNWPTPMARKARELERKGYKVSLDTNKQMPEDVFEMIRPQAGMFQMINSALEGASDYKNVTLKDIGLTPIWDTDKQTGDKIFLLSGGSKYRDRSILESLGGKWIYQEAKIDRTPIPGGYAKMGFWEFKNPVDDIESKIVTRLQEAKNINPDIELSFSNILAERISNIFKARGARSHMIGRKSASGEDVWVGYEEDPKMAFAKYARGLAASESKRELAVKLTQAMTGTDISWDDYKAAKSEFGEKADWEEYKAFVKDRGISAVEQQNAFKDAKVLTEDMLRNQETVDRVVGTLKGLAVFKFLAGRVAAPLVNLTVLPTAVPAAMSGYANIPIKKGLGHVQNAGRLYYKYRRGQELSPDMKATFDEIESRGWLRPQYDREGLAVLRSKAGEKYQWAMDKAMIGFTVTEQFNRASSIMGTYLGIKERHKGVWDAAAKESALEKAKLVSDRANGVYGKANYPSWARGSHATAQIARSAYVFKTFSHNYILTMMDLGFNKKEIKASLWMLFSPAFLAGTGATVAMPLVNAVADAFGVDEEPEDWFYRQANEHLGYAGETFARQGLFGLARVNLKGSLAIGITDLPTSLRDLVGAPGSVVGDVFQGGKNIIQGDISKGIEKILPLALGNPIKAVREATEGVTTTTGSPRFYGDKQMKGDALDTVLRFFSFNPGRLSLMREKQWSEKKMMRRYSERRQDIYRHAKKFYGKPISERNKSDWAEILADIADYNRSIKQNKIERLVSPITRKKIMTMLKRAYKPSRRERERGREAA